MKKFAPFVLLALSFALSSCAKLTLAWADLKPDGVEAAPEVLGEFEGAPAVTSVETWENDRAPMLRTAFEEYVYGRMPDSRSLDILEYKVIDEKAFSGAGVLEEYKLQAHAVCDGSSA